MTLRPRRLDEQGWHTYLEEALPRFVLIRVRAERARFAWAVPLWPFEEILAFALGVLAFMPEIVRVLPESARARLPAGSDGKGAPLRTLGIRDRIDALAGGSARDLLRLPRGTPYLSIEAGTTHIEVVSL